VITLKISVVLSVHYKKGNQHKPFFPSEDSLSCGSWRRPFGFSEILPWESSGYQVMWCKYTTVCML